MSMDFWSVNTYGVDMSDYQIDEDKLVELFRWAVKSSGRFKQYYLDSSIDIDDDDSVFKVIADWGNHSSTGNFIADVIASTQHGCTLVDVHETADNTYIGIRIHEVLPWDKDNPEYSFYFSTDKDQLDAGIRNIFSKLGVENVAIMPHCGYNWG